ncbi:MAG: VWA domain-containing protein [Blastocatellia bacterium]|nr:VWA domain-containing protein [Blastocatellia bacterium]
MTFLNPIWLLLALPMALALYWWRFSSRWLRVLRIAMALLVLFSLAGLCLKFPGRTGTVVVVTDRSLSMPADADTSHRAIIDRIQKEMGSEERLAVVSFGERSHIEHAPQAARFPGFTNVVQPDASNLSAGIEKALALIPSDGPGKIVIVSDGRWTGPEPSSIAAQAATRGITLDYAMLERPATNDIAVSQLEAPVKVTPGESFMLSAWVQMPTEQPVTYRVLRGQEVIAEGTQTFPAGVSRLTFRDTGIEPGTQSYRIEVKGTNPDPIPENNTARLLVGVEGNRPLLCVSQDAQAGFARLLAASGVSVKPVQVQNVNWTIEELSKYSAVILENVPADKIGQAGMETLAAWVKETGAGLMMTGGKNSYGPGGYFRSPIEPILPVSMELKSEHRKLALAIVVTMDRSGSMAAPAGGGKVKMDLANLAAAQVLDLLSPMDEFGCIAVDSQAHTVADLSQVNNKEAERSKILRVESGGGGIFIYEALQASAEMLLKAKSGTKHIILFADAADSEEPGKYKELLEQCQKSNITVSVIGLGKPTDVDAELLRDVAKRGGGQCFFTENAEELPRLFAQDTFVVARNTFLDQLTEIKFTGGMTSLTGKQFAGPVKMGGYNLCYTRPTANLAALTVDEYNAPVVAAWQAGVGRVLTYAGEANGAYTGPVANWNEAGAFFSSLARWTAGTTDTLPENMLLTQEVANGTNTIRLNLDPEKDLPPFRDPPTVTTLHGTPGQPPQVEKTTLRWTSADALSVDVNVKGTETSLTSVDIPGFGAVSLTPVLLPYSPEYKPRAAADGLFELQRLAQATGGKERLDVSGIWKEFPRRPRYVELKTWMLLAAVLLLLAEVLERRTLMLSDTVKRWKLPQIPTLPALAGKPAPPAGKPVAPVGTAKPAVPVPAATTGSASRPTEAPAPPRKEKPQEGMVGALRKAREQARKRTED